MTEDELLADIVAQPGYSLNGAPSTDTIPQSGKASGITTLQQNVFVVVGCTGNFMNVTYHVKNRGSKDANNPEAAYYKDLPIQPPVQNPTAALTLTDAVAAFKAAQAAQAAAIAAKIGS